MYEQLGELYESWFIETDTRESLRILIDELC